MKKIISLVLALMLMFSIPAFATWNKNKPAGSDLISDIDTLVISNNTAVESAIQNMHGLVNLKVVRTNVTTVTVTADSLWLQKSGDLAREFTSVSEAIAITTSGASGLDTGAEGNVWYYIWIIAKDDNTINGLLSASATAPTLPSGYTYKTLVSAAHNTSGDFVNFIQEGRVYTYVTDITIASGTSSSWASIDITAYVPSAISSVAFGGLFTNQNNGLLSSDASLSGAVSWTTKYNNSINCLGSGGNQAYWKFQILTANTLMWAGSGVSVVVAVSGFEINLIS